MRQTFLEAHVDMLKMGIVASFLAAFVEQNLWFLIISMLSYVSLASIFLVAQPFQNKTVKWRS